MTAALLLAIADGARAAGPQQVDLDVSTGDGTTAGHATLWVSRALHGGFDVEGDITDAYNSRGCVTLSAVELHAGLTTGGDAVARVCRAGETEHVSFHTGHHAVVLSVIEPWWAPNWDSRTVTLHG
ncbi:hypothetical protein [Streptacidiphilus rugosus]|uniref:hypothetical protein n=1 Tax=Streptacidiphilus rugosus TaxID=405783 RepID=UPI0012F7EE28|nr:hypothetical protein [Streptacidiphilus rugosus]